MQEIRKCQVYGCAQNPAPKPNEITVPIHGADPRTFVVCLYHQELLQTSNPGTLKVGLTYQGDVEIRRVSTKAPGDDV